MAVELDAGGEESAGALERPPLRPSTRPVRVFAVSATVSVQDADVLSGTVTDTTPGVSLSARSPSLSFSAGEMPTTYR